ncbi:flagellar biosynthesis repressor FlbT [Stappia taiwanensis]|uniref:Flagellar biosynthesis repressor FlbT n=1 Tax=Stappia taiwanensis TaxID=992267 RepID=A0A838XKQ8_9HYPH|nr:flagellar biosynthesis repressor FlbT [Stappia taiwanensis]MBA4610437.1 flagellar biosynthesis repressor FlbT [Stappia taiwanensis]GGE85000.1 putative flagellum biosynthesis repressor protein FlbT 1 [Stappia taiwanensis]
MALKIELRPRERFIVGSTVITNGDHRTHIFIEGKEPLLREKDIYTAETANTPAKRIYLAVQLMYLNQDIESHREIYFELIDDFIRAAPSTIKLVDAINNEILTGSLYGALKRARDLVECERELIENVQSGHRSIPADNPIDGQSEGAGSDTSSEGGGPSSGGQG